MKRITFINLTFLTLVSLLFGIELQTYDAKIIRIGVVDMDRVINEHPSVKNLQQDILLYKENKNVEIAGLEKEIDNLLKQKLTIITEIEQLKAQLNIVKKSSDTQAENLSPDVQLSSQMQSLTSAIEIKQKNLEELNRAIEEKSYQIKQKKQEIETDVEKMKQRVETTIYAELYKIIQEVAQTEGLNVIINKSGILYGEPDVDITEKVIRKLRR